MTVWRKEYRDAARAAIEGDPHFSGFQRIGLWQKSINADLLPVFGLGTPFEGADLNDSNDNSMRATRLVVVIKRMGSDLEDDLDLDSAKIEALIVEAIAADDALVELKETTYKEDPDGGQSVATLTMAFVITHWPYTAA